MADALKIFSARTQLYSHSGRRQLCTCAPCEEARAILDEHDAEQKRALERVGEQFVAEVRASREGGEQTR